MPPEAASMDEIREHGWCLQLMQSQAFGFVLTELRRLEGLAQRNVCAEDAPSRDFQAGRLSALVEAQAFVANRYAKLKPKVEVIPE